MDHQAQPCTLYYNYYSSCSCYVRHTFEIAGEPRDASSRLEIREQPVDIFKSGQLDEHFLCDVNPKGQVPVIVPESTGKPITDSLDITHFLGDHYPRLFPDTHRDEINKLLKALHSISLFSITFRDRPQLPQKNVIAIQDRLQGDISDRYRDALNYKLTMTSEKQTALEPASAAENEVKTKEIMNTLSSHLSKDSPWLFGLPHPSALDAHLAIVLARLKDVNRFDLVPVDLQRYAEAAWETAAYKKVMGGRRTLPGL